MPPEDPTPGAAPRPGRNRRVHGDTAPVVARGRGTVIPGAARGGGGSPGAGDATPAGFASSAPNGVRFDPARFDADGFDTNGFDTNGFDTNGFDANGFDADGFVAAGLDPARFDPARFDTGALAAVGGDTTAADPTRVGPPGNGPMHESVAPGRNRVPVTQPTQIVQPDWITEAQRRAAAEGAWTPTGEPPAWVPGAMDEPTEAELGESASLVRPYARTGGRTKPVRHLDLEALVRTTVNGKEASTSPLLSPEHSSVIALCTGTVSVAEIAARLSVPLGVARVIIADMVDLGLVEVMKTSAVLGDERDPEFLRRVLSGLQRL